MLGTTLGTNLGPGLVSLLAATATGRPAILAPSSAGAGNPASAMADLLASLTMASPGGAQGLTASLPTPGSGLAGALAAVLGLFRSPGIRSAIGEDGMAALRRTGADGQIDRALNGARPRLSDGPPGTTSGAGPSGTERPGGEWRHWALPIATGTDIAAINLYWRRESDGEDDVSRDGDGPTDRFVVDLTLSAFGATRVDSRIDRGRRRLAIVLATEAPLAPTMKRDLNRLVAATADGFGLAGRLAIRRASGLATG